MEAPFWHFAASFPGLCVMRNCGQYPVSVILYFQIAIRRRRRNRMYITTIQPPPTQTRRQFEKRKEGGKNQFPREISGKEEKDEEVIIGQSFRQRCGIPCDSNQRPARAGLDTL